MLYEYTSGGKQLDGDVLAQLSQTKTYQHIQDLENQVRILTEENQAI